MEFEEDWQYLFLRAVRRSFPDATIHLHCGTAEALATAGAHSIDAAIVHRATDSDGIAMIQALKRVHAAVPILLISGQRREHDALAAGASACLDYAKWSSIGNVVQGLLGSHPA